MYKYSPEVLALKTERMTDCALLELEQTCFCDET